MEKRGLRSRLQPTLYAGIAALLHGMLFLIPLGGSANRPDTETTRGIRIRAYIESPAVSPRMTPPPQFQAVATPPSEVAEKRYSVAGNSNPVPTGGVSIPTEGSPIPPGGSPGSPADYSGRGGIDQTNRDGDPPQGEYGQYLARLRSEGVQGWAKDSARSLRQGWKGTGTGTGGWGTGTGTGIGSGAGGGKEGGYLDPRVRMLVVRYPLDKYNSAIVSQGTNIESRYRQIPYPDLKFKRKDYVAGWWNVYINLRIDGDGNKTRMDVLRPETEGELERQFVNQVKKEIAKWSFDPMQAEIIVDVRFYVE